MSKETYKIEDIYAYLLGNLSEAEAEVFDELSFTDEDFTFDLKNAENDLVDAYIKNELSGEQLRSFQSFYLATPKRREKVEFANTFRDFTEREYQNIPAISSEDSTEREKGFFKKWLFVPKLSLQWGFALATLALLIFGGFLWLENSRLEKEIGRTQTNRNEVLQRRENELVEREKQIREEIKNQQLKNSEIEKETAEEKPQKAALDTNSDASTNKEKPRLNQQKTPQPEVVKVQKTPTKKVPTTPQPKKTQPPVNLVTFILTPSLRGNNDLKTIEIPSGTNFVEMRLQLESDDFGKYKVFLQDSSGEQNLWQSVNLKSRKSGADNFLVVRISSKLLSSEIYNFAVQGIKDDGTEENIASYPFQVVK